MSLAPQTPTNLLLPLIALMPSLSSHETSDLDDSPSNRTASPSGSDPLSSLTITFRVGANSGRFYDPPSKMAYDVGSLQGNIGGTGGADSMQKEAEEWMVVTLLSVGTGGIRNNRRPLNEEPREYANRCAGGSPLPRDWGDCHETCCSWVSFTLELCRSREMPMQAGLFLAVKGYFMLLAEKFVPKN
ncbi:nucleic acid-binding, OB-fold-like protein [Actinidia rufa]|uniref:Nucleic acid-binding, OB-fold-like protein n=1 Tax=Actinidia rufa TaxID=165716 RepID=A0A7J0DR55_9ERIC|nr:nucleic acid-binding, OB-fold-like protein [Actinidia rufa]